MCRAQRVALAGDQREEVAALEPQRLVGRDLRAVDVAGPRLPLAVLLGRLPRALLEDRHLALQLHVVEDDHLLLPDDRDPPHLLRVEPGEVHVRDHTRGEAEVAEDDVLDPGREVRVAVRPALGRLLVEQVEDHREVVDAERRESVLVRADLPEVLAVRVEVEHLAELAGVDEPLQRRHARVVEQQVAGHQHEAVRLGGGDEILGVGRARRRRLLDEDVLAGLERALRELVVRRGGGGDDDRVQLRVGEHLVVVRGRPRPRIARPVALERVRRRVADPAQLGEVGEVAGQVRAPVAEADQADPDGSAGGAGAGLVRHDQARVGRREPAC